MADDLGIKGNNQTFYWDGNVTGMADGKTDGIPHPYLIYGYDEFGNGLYDDLEKVGIPNPYSRHGEGQPFGYTGYQPDRVAGTCYAQAREYMPENGRFGAVDVIKGNIMVPETLNEYGYCLGNPMIYTDRTGMVAYLIYDDSNDDDIYEAGYLHNYANLLERKRLEKLYGEAPIMCPVTSLEETGNNSFAYVWINQIGYDEEGNAVEIDEVSIIAHGNKEGIQFNGDSFKTDYLEDYPKKIKTVTINSCNAGNIDNDSNIARVFLQTQDVEEVIAWDGTLGFMTGTINISGLSVDQRAFFEQEEKRTVTIFGLEIEIFPRCPMGRLTYKLDENGEEIVINSEGRRVYYGCAD